MRKNYNQDENEEFEQGSLALRRDLQLTIEVIDIFKGLEKDGVFRSTAMEPDDIVTFNGVLQDFPEFRRV